MSPRLEGFLRKWHRMLGLTRQTSHSWHKDRLREELHERRTVVSFWRKLSETSDVFFSISRARYDGVPIRNLPPLTTPRHCLVYAYMLLKFTSRWKFYRIVARIAKAPRCQSVREVVNPSKDHKLLEVAARHGIDSEHFLKVGRRLRRVWPLFP
ncbi:hypothetical protein G7046_g8987 [Stylonectria norvegica]|nr:hypothetical protein G7046_g8987 [Stylonectria norvegica]